MIRLAGRRHLRHRVLQGPADRTLVELWLTGIAGLVVNGYPEPRSGGSARTSPSWRLNPAGHAPGFPASAFPASAFPVSGFPASGAPVPVPADATAAFMEPEPAAVQRLVARAPGTERIRRAA
jgi:hypothetical protein